MGVACSRNSFLLQDGREVRLGRYELRKPWVKYVEVDLEKKVYWAIRVSILEDLLREAKNEESHGS